MHEHGAEQEHACDANADGRLLYNHVRTKVTARMDGGMAMDWRRGRGRAEVGILRMYMHGCLHNFVYCLSTAPALQLRSCLVYLV